jgi:hypothetical protein
VISPPAGIARGAMEQLRGYGPIRALVAPNAFHHLGLVDWHTRFPEATVFAPQQSIERVKRHTKIDDIRPLSEAASISGPRAELVDMPHYRTGELLLRIRTEAGIVWYVTDVITNLSELPRNPLFKLLYRVSGSAPGLKFNNFAALAMVRRKKALKRWLAEQIDAAPPRWLIPAHGEIAAIGDQPETLRRVVSPAP